MTTVVTQTQQTCTKPLSLRSTCLYQTDGPDFATGPHTLPIKLNIYTHYTYVLHFCIPQIQLKCLSSIKKWAVSIHWTRLYSTHPKWWFSNELGWTWWASLLHWKRLEKAICSLSLLTQLYWSQLRSKVTCILISSTKRLREQLFWIESKLYS